jgi:hypothetical protein
MGSRALLIGSLIGLAACHATQPTPARELLPIIDGFALKEPLTSAAPRLLSCNPVVDKPAPITHSGRWCWAAGSLLLLFSDHDSLVQMQLSTLMPSRDTLLTAEDVWRARSALFSDMMRGPPDSLLVKPIGRFSVHRWPDPRGPNAQVLRACWFSTADRSWYGNVWLYDEMTGPDTAATRAIIEVFAGTDSPPACFIGPP